MLILQFNKIMLTAASAAFQPSFSVTSKCSCNTYFSALSNTSSGVFVSNLPNNTTINGAENVKIKSLYNNGPRSKGFLIKFDYVAKGNFRVTGSNS
jgi:hypothetical protein